MKTEKIIEVIKTIAVRISEEKDYLTALDNAIGDGDHGINLNRGFEAVIAKADSLYGKAPGEVLKNVGMTLVSTVGGASGPLYGTLFMYMGKEFGTAEEIDTDLFIKAFKCGIEGVRMRGKSDEGEKTMLDAMIPALNAMESSESKVPSKVLAEGYRAASEGLEHTKEIIATKGRASYVGERSLGHLDPGAASFCMMLDEVKRL